MNRSDGSSDAKESSIHRNTDNLDKAKNLLSSDRALKNRVGLNLKSDPNIIGSNDAIKRNQLNQKTVSSGITSINNRSVNNSDKSGVDIAVRSSQDDLQSARENSHRLRDARNK